MAGSPTWKIYIINLERAVVRKQFMLQQFKKLGITNYEFIAALDGSKLGTDWLEAQLDQENLVRPLRPTEIACAISHKMALEHFIKQNNADYAVILEDDVLLPKNFNEIVNNSIQAMTGEEAVLLSGSLHTKQQFKKIKPLDGNTNLIQAVKPIEQIYFAAAYIMSKKVAAQHAKVIFPVTDVADSWWYYKGKGSMKDIWLAFPYPVRQEIFQSTRGKKAMVYDMINWTILHKIPVLYQFFTERRTREERNRLNNVELIN
ncbi:MAG: glycosyltransferase family 25 protein [Sphingobacteriales bacterium]|nr:MAG: glycosyltransferase family 25 protein [Sphingobacteriales bacterium]